jgi:hypothetical protein
MKLLLPVLLLSAGAAHAALGGAPSVVGKPLAPRAAAAALPYSVLQSALPSGTTVSQYVDAKGVVFAVAWAGPVPPDLHTLLGAHFETFTARARAQRGNANSHLQVAGDDLVVVSSGHMGALAGKAWLPSRLPAGFRPQDIH